MMNEDKELHRKLGIDFFNFTWSYLDKPQRTRQEADTMIHAAHASRFHWEMSGCEPVNLARGEWQISRVYAVLGRAEPAHFHAQRSLDICLEYGIGDFDLAFAYEALARAAAVGLQASEHAKYLALAQQAAEHIADPEDKKLVLHDLETI